MPKRRVSLAKQRRDWEKRVEDGRVVRVSPNRWRLACWPEPEGHESQVHDYAPSDILDAMKEYCKGIRRCPKSHVFTGDKCELSDDCYGRSLFGGPNFHYGAEESLGPPVISMLEDSDYLRKRASSSSY